MLKKSEIGRNMIVGSVDRLRGKDNALLFIKKITYVLCTAILVILWAIPAQGAPRLTIPESVFDFGYVPQNSTISHVFWLYSTGDDTLKIINIKPG